jgi:hypothetical protein
LENKREPLSTHDQRTTSTLLLTLKTKESTMPKSHTRSFQPFDSSATTTGLTLAFAVLTLLTSIGAAGAATPSVTVENPSMRFIIKSHPAAGYFTLQNNTGSAIDLTGASSSACGMLMLHQSKEVNGVEKMLPVKRISVSAHGTVLFAPGGYHLMCMSPSNAMKVGATVPVTLKFADGKTISARFPVKGVNVR